MAEENVEEQVKRLEEQLQQEKEKTSAVEKEVEELKAIVVAFKKETGMDITVPKEGKGANKGKTKNQDSAKKESSSSSSEEESEDESEEESENKKASTSLLQKEGILEKKGSIRHNWVKRYFVLDGENHTLSYYEKKGDKDRKGLIPLINATCYAHVEKKGVVKPLFFNIRTENKDFLLKASSSQEKAEWVKAIKACCVKGELSPEVKKHTKKSQSFIGRTVEEESKATKKK